MNESFLTAIIIIAVVILVPGAGIRIRKRDFWRSAMR